MNEVLKAMIERRSCRKYKPDAVPQEKLDAILEAGLYAASGRGQQAAICIAVTDRAVRDALSKVNCEIGGWDAGFDPFYGAPMVIAVLADRSRPTYVYDGSLVLGNLMLAAHAVGLASCWIHRAKETFEREEGKRLLKQLGIEGDWEGVGFCILGVPDGDLTQPPERKENRIYTV